MTVMPKRRKSKDNPYTIIILDNKYLIKFKDNQNIIQIIEISEEIYNAFNKFELEDKSQMNKYDKHIEHSEIYEESLYKRAFNKPISIEDEVQINDDIYHLKKAIDKLPSIQKRRIKMYYFDDLKLEEIAKIEGCSFQAVSKSIGQALENLKKFIKFKN